MEDSQIIFKCCPECNQCFSKNMSECPNCKLELHPVYDLDNQGC